MRGLASWRTHPVRRVVFNPRAAVKKSIKSLVVEAGLVPLVLDAAAGGDEESDKDEESWLLMESKKEVETTNQERNARRCERWRMVFTVFSFSSSSPTIVMLLCDGCW